MSKNLLNPHSNKNCVLGEKALWLLSKMSVVSFATAYLIKNSEMLELSGQRPELFQICLLPFCLSLPRTSPGFSFLLRADFLSSGIRVDCLSGWSTDIAVRESLLLFPRKTCSVDDDFERYSLVWSNWTIFDVLEALK